MAKASVAFTVKVGKKGKAKAHANYILREGKYAPNPEKKSTAKYEDLILTGHGNLPKWANDNPALFFEMSDEFERKNGSTYREEIIPLPREFDRQQQAKFINEWIEQEIGDKHAFAFAIHEPLASDGKPNPHVHLMKSDRIIDEHERPPEQYFKRYNSKKPERGGAKKANTGLKSSERKTLLYAKRDRFEKMINKHLVEIGHDDKTINMKSLKEQGIDRQPINIPMKPYKRIDKVKQTLDNIELKRDSFVQIVNFDINKELAKFAQQQRKHDDEIAQEQAQLEQEQERRRLERQQAEREPKPFIEMNTNVSISNRHTKQNFESLYERHNNLVDDMLKSQTSSFDAIKRASDFYELVKLFEDDIISQSSARNCDIDELNKVHKSIEELKENFDKLIDKSTIKDNRKVVHHRATATRAIDDTDTAISKRLDTTQAVAPTTTTTLTNRPAPR